MRALHFALEVLQFSLQAPLSLSLIYYLLHFPTPRLFVFVLFGREAGGVVGIEVPLEVITMTIFTPCLGSFTLSPSHFSPWTLVIDYFIGFIVHFILTDEHPVL